MLLHFQRLLDDLSMIREEVASLESPNAEDDVPVKFAIVGYCYHRPVESWGREEFDFVTGRSQGVAGFDPPWVEFTCLERFSFVHIGLL